MLPLNALLFAFCALFARVSSSCDLIGQHLHCDGVSLEQVNTDYRHTKDTITSARITRCSTTALNETVSLFTNAIKLELACGIEAITPPAFDNANNLIDLVLRKNQLWRIDGDTFKNAHKLKRLDLSGNALRSVSDLSGLRGLRVLLLSGNQMKSLRKGDLDSCAGTRELYLDGNKLQSVEVGVFDALDELEVLDLFGNYVSELRKGLFVKNAKLRKLVMGRNVYAKLPFGLFAKDAALEELDVSHTKITEFPSGVFDSLINLKKLVLAGNSIHRLHHGLFDKLANLQHLDLSRMQLKTLPAGLLTEKRKLHHLDLSLNALRTLPEPLINTTAMRFFNASRNNLAAIPKALFQWVEIEEVDFSHNQIEEIDEGVLGIESLSRVHLHNNRLYTIHAMLFASCDTPITYVDVRNNRLAFISAEFFDWVPNLERMEIVGNPWDCKCFEQLMQVFRKNYISYSKEDYFNGEKSVCIALNPFECNVDEKHVRKYYEEYLNQLTSSAARTKS